MAIPVTSLNAMKMELEQNLLPPLGCPRIWVALIKPGHAKKRKSREERSLKLPPYRVGTGNSTKRGRKGRRSRRKPRKRHSIEKSRYQNLGHESQRENKIIDTAPETG